LTPFPGTEVREKAKEYGLRILTNDWLRYNANEAIIETEDVNTTDLEGVDREYQEKIRYWIRHYEESERQGKLSPIELERMKEIKAGRYREISIHLLQGDIIENLGRMETKGDVIEELAVRISNETPYPLTDLRQWTRDMISKEILKYETREGNVVWQWG